MTPAQIADTEADAVRALKRALKAIESGGYVEAEGYCTDALAFLYQIERDLKRMYPRKEGANR